MKFFSLLLLGLLVSAPPAQALTGFFVGQDETPIAAPATKIIIASHKNHHTLTILPSVASTARDMALLIPVPAGTTEQNIREGSAAWFDAIDTLSAPRLREETDPNPCVGSIAKTGVEVKSYAVTTKHVADDTQYDISILPADQAANLVTWLETRGYKLPPKTDRIIIPYTQRSTAFVLAKLRRSGTDSDYLKPLQISYDAMKLILPVRLGLVNAPAVTVTPPKVKEVRVLNAAPDKNDPHEVEPIDLFNDGGQAITLYVITQQGKAGSTLMRSIPMASARMDTALPSYVTADFPSIYNRILNMRVKTESNALMLEYAGEAQLPADVLTSLGVNWLNEKPLNEKESARMPATADFGADPDNLIGGMMLPKAALPERFKRENAPAGKPFLTRLYFRYNATTLPQDIGLTESQSRETFNLRFFTHLPAVLGTDTAQTCDTSAYERSVLTRLAHDEQNLARMTGLSVSALQQKLGVKK